MRTNLLERVLDIGWAVGYVVGNGLIAAVIVFGFAYAQEVAFWNWTSSLGPDLYVAGGMAVFAFFVTAWASVKEV